MQAEFFSINRGKQTNSTTAIKVSTTSSFKFIQDCGEHQVGVRIALEAVLGIRRMKVSYSTSSTTHIKDKTHAAKKRRANLDERLAAEM